MITPLFGAIRQRSHSFAVTVFAVIALLVAPLCEAQTAPPALPATVTDVPAAKSLGGGLLRKFGFQIYRAYLWTPEGSAFDRNKPHALDIEYLRNFTAKALAERSIDEMRAQGVGSDTVYPKWLSEMQRVFADVKPGDRITGVVTATKASKFFHNGNLRGEVNDAAFTEAFFGIWLNENTSEPAFRKLLLGGKQ
jgi:hypothetical protein